MKVFRIATVVVLLTAPAYAQAPNINLMPELQSKSPEEKEQEAQQQKAYKESLKKIPDAKASSDPWGNVRSVDTPKATAKASTPVKSRSKATRHFAYCTSLRYRSTPPSFLRSQWTPTRCGRRPLGSSWRS